MSYQAFQKYAQYYEIEHIQRNMQQVCMQKNWCDKTPVLPLNDQVIRFCAIRNQDIGKGIIIFILDIDGIIQGDRDDIVEVVRTSCQGKLISSNTPDNDSANCNAPCSP